MTHSARPVEAKTPWDNRWHKPRIEQLLEPLEQNRRNLFVRVMDQIEALEGMEKDLVWLGISWRWTIRFNLDHSHSRAHGQDQSQPQAQDVAFAYLIPNPRQPTVCIPLSDEQIEALPQRGLNRYIRDGVKSAKQGVAVHWGKWIATSHAEVDHLTDLAKRKYRMITEPSQDAAA